ncbi:hypothetical protein JCM11251_001625 [Rhodosporidiobolus azoricus]
MAESAAPPTVDTTAPPATTLARSVPLDAARARQTATTDSTSSVSTSLARPMYIPAVLQAPKNKHLLGAMGKKQRGEDGDELSRKKGSSGGGGPGGKRKRRRWENAQLAGNPHLHRPTRSDFAPGPYMKGLSTTFSPPPSSFSRSTYISSSPSSFPSHADLVASADAGQFSLSLRGLRKNLRTAVGSSRRGEGGRTEEVLEIMERELVAWLTLSGRIPEGFYHESAALGTRGGKPLDPTPLDDLPSAPLPSLPDLPSSSPSAPLAPPTLTELSRQPHTLVWLAPSPHHRYLLHALARYYSLQSFSRPLSPLEPDQRVTHILRPQLVRPRAVPGGGAGLGVLETPPVTDLSTAGGTTTEGELTAGESSAYETDTDTGSVVDGDEWDRVSVASGVPATMVGGTDDEAEAVYSTESDSATGEDSEYDGDGGLDSLASSFADLSAGSGASSPPSVSAPSSAAPAPFSPLPFAPAPSSGAATPSRPSPSSPFISLSASTPVPSFRLSPLSLPHASVTAADATPTRRTAARGCRPLPPPGGYDSPAESSPSRSRDREAAGRVFAGVPAGEWRMPEREFLDWVLE